MLFDNKFNMKIELKKKREKESQIKTKQLMSNFSIQMIKVYFKMFREQRAKFQGFFFVVNFVQYSNLFPWIQVFVDFGNALFHITLQKSPKFWLVWFIMSTDAHRLHNKNHFVFCSCEWINCIWKWAQFWILTIFQQFFLLYSSQCFTFVKSFVEFIQFFVAHDAGKTIEFKDSFLMKPNWCCTIDFV